MFWVDQPDTHDPGDDDDDVIDTSEVSGGGDDSLVDSGVTSGSDSTSWDENDVGGTGRVDSDPGASPPTNP